MPKTLAEFEKALATAKKAGETPIAFGNLEKWPGIHEFQSVLMAVAPAAQVGNTVFGKPGSKWSTPAVLKTAAIVQKWAKAGYYSDGYAGLPMRTRRTSSSRAPESSRSRAPGRQVTWPTG